MTPPLKPWLAAALLLPALQLCYAADPTYWDISKVKEVDCPEGYRWRDWQDNFYTRLGRGSNPYDPWTFERGGVGSVHDATGMPMKLKEGKGNNDTALVSACSWAPPVWIEMEIQSTGAPGIPSTFNFRKDGVSVAEEIDFIIASRVDKASGNLKHFVSTPIYVPKAKGPDGKPKTTGSDAQVGIVLAKGTKYETNSSGTFGTLDNVDAEAVYQDNWAITWDGLDPAVNYNTYAIKWLPDTIEWWAGELNKAELRVTINKKTEEDGTWPKGPLPMRIGPWEAGGDWAGVVDWAKYPAPLMKAAHVKVKGCRLIVPKFDEELDSYSSRLSKRTKRELDV